MRRVIKDGQKETRSSVLLVNGEVDGGPLLAVSRPAPVSFDAEGLTKQQLAERVMEHWNNVHKPICEWAFFPEVISMVAEKRFAADSKGNLYFDGSVLRHPAEVGNADGE